MKPKKLELLEAILRLMAKAVLWRHSSTRIVGITGSIGKTSAKEAVFAVLSSKFKVRKNEKNYNNEIGIPLTIIGARSGNRSVLGWINVFLKWLLAIIGVSRYPEIIILEMGVDRPGDMEYLLTFVKPQVGIITNISSSHLEFFNTLENIAQEKSKLIRALPENGMAILNNDDDLALGMKDEAKSEKITFGFGEFADVSASNAVFAYEEGVPQGITFKLSYAGSVLPMRLPNVIAPHLVYGALSAVATGIYFKLNLVDIAAALKNFKSPAGRMNLIEGVKNSYLIDDTYNSSPLSALSALEVLENLEAKRKIAVLGDMLELGAESEAGHEKVAAKVLTLPVDRFLVVGDRMKKAVLKKTPAQFSKENILFFDDPMSAGKILQKIMLPGDLVLIKGSQGMRMEKVVEEVMRHPEKSEELLCRQDANWREKGFVKP